MQQQSKGSRKSQVQTPVFFLRDPGTKPAPKQAQRKSPYASYSLLLHPTMKESEALLTDTGWPPGADNPINMKDARDSKIPRTIVLSIEATLQGMSPPLGLNRLPSHLYVELHVWIC